mmetsp:Transcript_23092/g.68034  ORF Transcript_23092/g.68034 Transcript_23092/m.68034 type:complete len:159 (-) Transcript_23092:190-666(-)
MYTRALARCSLFRPFGVPSLRRPLRPFCSMRAPRAHIPGVRTLSQAPDYPKQGTVAKLRWLVKEYGAIGVATHFSVYFTTLGGLFLGVDNGVFAAGDALETLKYMGVDNIINLDKLNPTASNFAVAWILAKFTEPLRLPVTLWLTPRIAQFVRFRGLR